MTPYIPAAWYWIVAGDESRAWSSALPGYVPADNAAFHAWLADGGTPSRITSEAELSDVLYAAGEWARAPRPVPQSVPMVNLQLELYTRNLLSQADALAHQVGGSVLIYWSRAQVAEREHPLIVQFGAALGLDAAGIDDVFIHAAGL